MRLYEKTIFIFIFIFVSGFKMIREVQLKDKEQWEKLYKGYADFYKVEMNNKILQTVWNWLHDKNHEVGSLTTRGV